MPAGVAIHTVLGRVPPERWGVTLCHEHLAVDLSTSKQDPDAALTDVELVIAEVADLVEAGGRCVVEVSCHGMGRDVRVLQRVAAATGCQVVCATGFYYGRFLPALVHESDADALAELFTQELVDGIPESGGIRAGIVAEIGTSLRQVLPVEEKVLRAAALAHRRTGAPIMTHTSLGTMALEQLAVLDRAGADPAKVGVSHLDLVDDVEYHVEVARRGAYVQYDTVGKQRYQPDEVRVRLVLEMLDRGWADRLMLSCDVSRPSYLRRRGGYGYRHLLTDFVPRLRAAGVDDGTLRTILVENPARFLAH